MMNAVDIDTVKKQFENSMNGMLDITKQIETRLKYIEEREQRLAALEKRMKENAETSKSKILLNVGGKKFATSKTTLLSRKETYFYAMLSTGHWQPDEDGEYFIDRNPKYFGIVLDFLRSGRLDTQGLDSASLERLLEDLDYYQVNHEESIAGGNPLFEIGINAAYLFAACQNTSQSLLDGNKNTGVCCDSPGWLIVDFKKVIPVKNVQLIGFHGNPSQWSPSNGSNATIMYSNDMKSWTSTDQTTGDLTSLQTIQFKCFQARYVQFSSTSYLGFGILQFNV